MSALLQMESEISQHHWMLWISPSKEQIKQIKQLPLSEQQRVLMLHPKKPEQICRAIELAITSGNYQSITLERNMIPAQQQPMLELLAIRNQTHINWLGRRNQLNSASQLSLI